MSDTDRGLISPTKDHKNTVASYYAEILPKFRDRENFTLAKLDKMQTVGAAKASSSKTMSDAVNNTEKIRLWTEHTLPNNQLIAKFESDASEGLTTDAANLMIEKHGKNVLTDKD